MARSSPVPGWVPDDLPPAPGVYRFRDRGGELLYIGKSVNLRRRVRSYFYGGGPDDERRAEMLRLARNVTWVRTGGELEARLVEARGILEHQPPYNRALKSSGRAWYLELDPGRPFPRFRVVQAARTAGARYFGPFRNRSLPKEIARLAERIFRLRTCTERLAPDGDGSACLQYGVGLCTAPCIRAVGLDAYRRQVDDCLRALGDSGHAAAVRQRLVERRERAAEEWAFERAADLQRRIDWLDELESNRWALERPSLDRSWLLILPHVEEDRRLLLPVASGRVLDGRPAPTPGSSPRWEEAVKDVLYAVRVAELQSPSALPARELVPSLIVTRWLESGADGGKAVSLDGTVVGKESVLHRVQRALKTVGEEAA